MPDSAVGAQSGDYVIGRRCRKALRQFHFWHSSGGEAESASAAGAVEVDMHVGGRVMTF